MNRRAGRRLMGASLLLVAFFVVGMLGWGRDDAALDERLADDPVPSLVGGAGISGQLEGTTIQRPEAKLKGRGNARPKKEKRPLVALNVQVLDPAGEPLEGASVFARRQRWTKRADFQRGIVARRKTDDEGRVGLLLARSGRYTVEASHEGYAIARAGTFSTGDHVELRLMAQRMLRGVVLNPDGEPQPGAIVTATSPSKQATYMTPVIEYAMAETDRQGKFEFSTEQRDVMVTASHPLHLPSPTLDVSSKAHHEHPTLTLRLRTGEVLKTRVIDAETKRPIANVQVRASTGGVPARTDAEGRAQVIGHFNWDHGHIYFEAVGYAYVAVPVHRVADSTVALEPGVEIHGTLLRANDDPFDVRIGVYHPHENDPNRYIRAFSGVLQPKEDGSFSLDVVPEGYVVIWARLQGAAYVVRAFDIPDGGGDVGIIDLTTGSSVFGEVKLREGLKRAAVSITPGFDTRGYDREIQMSLRRTGSVTRDVPSFRFPGLLETGMYWVTVRAPGAPPVYKEVEVRSGEVGPVLVEFPNLAHMRFRIVDHAQRPLRVYASIQSSAGKSDADGWLDLYVKPNRDGPPGSPPNDRYTLNVNRDAETGKQLRERITVRQGQKQPVVIVGAHGVRGSLKDTTGKLYLFSDPIVVEAWVGNKRVASVKSDPKQRHTFVFPRIPQRGAHLRAEVTAAGVAYSGTTWVNPGQRKVQISMRGRRTR